MNGFLALLEDTRADRPIPIRLYETREEAEATANVINKQPADWLRKAFKTDCSSIVVGIIEFQDRTALLYGAGPSRVLLRKLPS